MDTPKSGFLPAFEHFWNGWASLRKDILLIICGSATSWMVNEVLYNRGGLHNRVTRPIPMDPFTLKECEEYAEWKRLPFDRHQIAVAIACAATTNRLLLCPALQFTTTMGRYVYPHRTDYFYVLNRSYSNVYAIPDRTVSRGVPRYNHFARH